LLRRLPGPRSRRLVTGLEIQLSRGATLRGRLIGPAPNQIPKISAYNGWDYQRA
jgi:hypothetical protein